jgi:hypothetical protein
MPYMEVWVDEDLNGYSDSDLIGEIESRGYRVRNKSKKDIDDDIFKLYQAWLDDKGDNDRRFEKALRKFFEENLNKISV